MMFCETDYRYEPNIKISAREVRLKSDPEGYFVVEFDSRDKCNFVMLNKEQIDELFEQLENLREKVTNE